MNVALIVKYHFITAGDVGPHSDVLPFSAQDRLHLHVHLPQEHLQGHQGQHEEAQDWEGAATQQIKVICTIWKTLIWKHLTVIWNMFNNQKKKMEKQTTSQ